MSKHTPGPWSVVNERGLTFICRADKAHLATVGAATDMRANAALIAAAPDLLEALQMLEGLFGPLARTLTEKAEIKNARAAIQKATQ